MKRRLRAVVSILILMSMSILSLYLWVDEVLEYLKFKDVILFSWMSVSLFFIPLTLPFPAYWFVLSLIFKHDEALSKVNRVIPYFKWVCIFSIITSILISFSYVSILKYKGYISCKGIPSGWMPSTATEYVKNKDLCYKKKMLKNELTYVDLMDELRFEKKHITKFPLINEIKLIFRFNKT